MVPDLDSDIDAQDSAEVYDEENTNLDEPRTWRTDDAEQLEDLPDVYDVISAVGDRDDEEARIGEEMDDAEIIAAEEEQDGADFEDDDLASRDGEGLQADSSDLDELDGVTSFGADEVELEYVGDLTDLAHARSAAQPMESRLLSDDDIEQLDYAPDPTEPTKKEATMQPQSQPETTKPKNVDPSETTTAQPHTTQDAHPKVHQEDLLDEGIEESFPASDPVSVKRIT